VDFVQELMEAKGENQDNNIRIDSKFFLEFNYESISDNEA
jgi:hypothetical protein